MAHRAGKGTHGLLLRPANCPACSGLFLGFLGGSGACRKSPMKSSREVDIMVSIRRKTGCFATPL